MPPKTRRYTSIRSNDNRVRGHLKRRRDQNVLYSRTMRFTAPGVIEAVPWRKDEFRLFQSTMPNLNICPVCGYGMEDPPNDWNICQCCGTEFGYDDSGTTYEALRAKWLRNGAKWWGQRLTPPENWSAESQVSSQLGLIAWESALNRVNGNHRAQVSAVPYNEAGPAYSVSGTSFNAEGTVEVQHGRLYSIAQPA